MSSKLWKIVGAIVIVLIITITIVAYGAENEEQLDESSISIEETTQIETEAERPIIIITDETNSPNPLEKKYATSSVNVRTTPEIKDDNIFTVLSRGNEISICTAEEGWYKILLGQDNYYVWAENFVTKDEWEELSKVPYSDAVPLSYEVQKYLWDKCQELGIKYCFALGTIQLESTFRPNATHHNGNGTTDRGLCQVNSCWIKKFKNMGYIGSSDDLYDPYTCINCGMWLLSQYTTKYGNCEKAYYCYNTGSEKGSSNKNSRLVMQYWEGWKAILGDI